MAARVGRRLAASMAVLGGAAVLVLMALHAAPVPPVGDTAIIESYVRHATDGVVLVGPYSRFQWHHPGPILFYVLAPFYALSGSHTAGLSAGAVAVNLVSLGGLIWIARRINGTLALAVLAATLLYVMRIAGVLASPWNPHILVFPLLLLFPAAALAVTSPAALPIVVLLGSFVVQTHVGAAPTVLAAVAFSFASSAYEARMSTQADAWPRFTKCVSIAFGFTVLLWAPPLAEELTRRPGNLTKLWRFFLGGSLPSRSLDASMNAWAGALTGLVRPAFEAAWGGAPPVPTTRLVEAGAAIQTMLLAGAGLHAWRRQRRFTCALSAMLFLASVASLWAVTRIAGEIIDHEVFWISTIGVLSAAVLADAALHMVNRGRSTLRPSVIGGWSALAAFVIAVASFVEFRHDLVNPHGAENEEAAVEALSVAIDRAVGTAPARTVLLDIDGPSWGVAAGLIVRLEERGIHVSVGPGAVWMFGEWTAPTGREGRRVAISAADRHQEVATLPGTEFLASEGGFYADAIPPESVLR